LHAFAKPAVLKRLRIIQGDDAGGTLPLDAHQDANVGILQFEVLLESVGVLIVGQGKQAVCRTVMFDGDPDVAGREVGRKNGIASTNGLAVGVLYIVPIGIGNHLNFAKEMGVGNHLPVSKINGDPESIFDLSDRRHAFLCPKFIE